MAAMVGANLEQMQALQRSFHAEAHNVGDLAARIAGVLHGTAWTGPAADAFRGQWDERFAPALAQLREALEHNGALVAERAQAIHQATA